MASAAFDGARQRSPSRRESNVNDTCYMPQTPPASRFKLKTNWKYSGNEQETQWKRRVDKVETMRRRSGYKLEIKWKHISVLSPLRFHFVASSQTFEIRLRGIASASWMGRIHIHEAEFPTGFGAIQISATLDARMFAGGYGG